MCVVHGINKLFIENIFIVFYKRMSIHITYSTKEKERKKKKCFKRKQLYAFYKFLTKKKKKKE